MAARDATIAVSEQATFMDLYDREARTVLRYCRMAVGDQDAEDVCADVFCSAWPAWSRFSGDDVKARAWLLRIARNKVIDRSRSRGRGTLVPLDENRDMAALEPDAADRMVLRAALRRLSSSEREVIELRSAGLSHAEIGAVQGRSEGAVKVACSRALGRLRSRLEETR